MTHRRFNELRGEEVIYASHRQERTFLPDHGDCPLCPARPDGVAHEIPRPAFEIAVFENRFSPFAHPDGAAEVIVYTDDHYGSFSSLSANRAEAVMWVWRDRYRALGSYEQIDYVLIFENRGAEVGVTLHHPHGQIYAFPFLPPVAGAERLADERRRRCAVCELVNTEQAQKNRIVYDNGAVVAYVPFAARWPYEVTVSFAEHRASLLDCHTDDMRALADALQAVTRGYDRLFNRSFPYVMCVHQAPTDNKGDGHVHVEFYPPLRSEHRLKYLAGCEQGAGTFLVDALPEETAPQIRSAIDSAR
jgi:UDPglucose--hexose-1-phosphate uridylyltransferase